MSGPETSPPADAAGADAFAFGEWPTPFTDAAVDILDLRYAPRERDRAELVVRVHAREAGITYRLVFPRIAAMRLLDEGGLLEFWRQTERLGGRPGRTSFRVRHHAWTRESALCFLASEGWSFVIASEDDCLEVVSATAPTITAEDAAAGPPGDGA
jgi:hypothetical protein